MFNEGNVVSFNFTNIKWVCDLLFHRINQKASSGLSNLWKIKSGGFDTKLVWEFGRKIVGNQGKT